MAETAPQSDSCIGSGARRRTLILFCVAFLGSLAVSILSLGVLFLVKESYAAKPEDVGWLSAFNLIFYFAGCVLLRKPAGKLGPRITTAAMVFLSAAIFALHIVFPGLPSIFIAYSLYGFLTALFWPPLEAWMTSGLEKNELAKAASAFNLAWSIGGFIAPYLSGLLSDAGVLYPIYASIGIFIAVGILIICTKKGAPEPERIMAPGQAERGAGGVREDHSTPLRYPAWIGGLLVYILMGVFANIFPLYAKDELHVSSATVGFALLVRAAFATAGFWLIGRISKWQFRKYWIVLPSAAGLLLITVLIFARSFAVFVVCLAVLGILQSIMYTNSMFYGASGALDRARRMTVHEMLLTIGQVVGSVAGGQLYGRLSFSSIFVFTGAVFVLGFAAQIVLLHKISTRKV